MSEQFQQFIQNTRQDAIEVRLFNGFMEENHWPCPPLVEDQQAFDEWADVCLVLYKADIPDLFRKWKEDNLN